MKNIIVILVLFAGFSFAQNVADTSGFNLTLKVINVSSDEGIISVALCNSKDNYDIGDEPFRGIKIPIKDGVAIYLYENLPAGEYAVKLYHDENNNGKLDTNFLGIPSEDYGFSNNATGMMGPASWEDAMFNLEENKTITIDLD